MRVNELLEANSPVCQEETVFEDKGVCYVLCSM